MILTCPECSTRYMAKTGTIDANGRSVRCARCETVWFVEAGSGDSSADALALEDNKAVLIEVEPDPQPELPFVPTSAPADIGAHTRLRNKVEADRLAKRRRVIQLIWVVPALALLGAATLAIMNRQAIVDKHPAAATTYRALGLKVKTNGLDVSNMTTEMVVVDGEAILRVTGDVRNLLPRSQTAKLLQLRLENRSGEAVADWFVEVGEIAADGTARIETDYPAPPLDGVELRYRLVDQ